MNRIKRFIFLAIFISSVSGYSQVLFLLSADGSSKKLNFAFGDEFNGNSLDRTKWDDHYGWARCIVCNKEMQYYSAQGNYRFENGTLSLLAKKEDVSARTTDWQADTAGLYCNNVRIGDNLRKFNYTSGMIQSKEKFYYGYYEICFKPPYGSGSWPAFWLFGGHENDEIDIFELKGEKENQIHVDVHCPKGCDDFKYAMGLKKNWGTWLKSNDALNKDFNTIGLLWEKGLLTWFLNGTAIASFSNYSYDYPLNLIANLAIANDKGPFNPGPNSKTPFPSQFEIDYIRYYSLTSSDTRNVSVSMLAEKSKSGPNKTSLKKKHKAMQGNVKPDVYAHLSVLPCKGGSLLLQRQGNLQAPINIKLMDVNSKLIFEGPISASETMVEVKPEHQGPFNIVIDYGKCHLAETLPR